MPILYLLRKYLGAINMKKNKELILPSPTHLDILINNFQYCANCKCQYNITSIDHIKQFYDLLYIEYTNNFIL